MKFGGELNKYVQFVTMFRNTFDDTIKDSSALYDLLVRHVVGQAKKAIETCIFRDPSINRYKEAMSILASRYGSKNEVICAHKQDLMCGKQISNSIADFEILANELKCFHSVLKMHF